VPFISEFTSREHTPASNRIHQSKVVFAISGVNQNAVGRVDLVQLNSYLIRAVTGCRERLAATRAKPRTVPKLKPTSCTVASNQGVLRLQRGRSMKRGLRVPDDIIVRGSIILRPETEE